MERVGGEVLSREMGSSVEGFIFLSAIDLLLLELCHVLPAGQA